MSPEANLCEHGESGKPGSPSQPAHEAPLLVSRLAFANLHLFVFWSSTRYPTGFILVPRSSRASQITWFFRRTSSFKRVLPARCRKGSKAVFLEKLLVKSVSPSLIYARSAEPCGRLADHANHVKCHSLGFKVVIFKRAYCPMRSGSRRYRSETTLPKLV